MIDNSPNSGLTSRTSMPDFFKGLAVVIVVYVLLFVWLWLQQQNIHEDRQARLAEKTVLIEWKKKKPVMAKVPVTKQDHEEIYDSKGSHIEQALTPAPQDELHEETPYGLLPAVTRNIQDSVFQVYRRPFDLAANNKPIIALAIEDIGLSNIASESAIKNMPSAVSFILSPYALTPDMWMTESRARGHEVWLGLPVETQRYPLDDPGPYTLLISGAERENVRKLKTVMAAPAGYVGFVPPYRPAFFSSTQDMRPIIGEILNRGLAFADTSNIPNSSIETAAVSNNKPYTNIDIWIDRPDATQDSVRQKLAELEEIARTDGKAVGILRALPISYQEVLKWIDTLDKKGIVLAPMSATTGY